MVYFDLNVPIFSSNLVSTSSKKDKGKGKVSVNAQAASYTAAQLSSIEARVDVLVHLGYTIIAFTQTALSKVDPKNHTNVLDPLLEKLKKRAGIVFLKRLNIILDEDSEKGFGLTTAATPFLSTFDIISLVPLTHATLSLACLSHSAPSPVTAHIISIPLSLPRLPYHLKHTLVRTARKNGTVFEINYGAALGASTEEWEGSIGIPDKKNWWANAREVVRVTKGKGIIFSSGVTKETGLRAPKDIENLVTFLGLAQDAAHEATTNTPKSLIIRTQTRKTYRAVLSEPTLIIPHQPEDSPPNKQGAVVNDRQPQAETAPPPPRSNIVTGVAITPGDTRKHPRDDSPVKSAGIDSSLPNASDGPSRKKKRKKKDIPNDI